jgi:glycosyltransferase involved in cell wall biosynthesis
VRRNSQVYLSIRLKKADGALRYGDRRPCASFPRFTAAFSIVANRVQSHGRRIRARNAEESERFRFADRAPQRAAMQTHSTSRAGGVAPISIAPTFNRDDNPASGIPSMTTPSRIAIIGNHLPRRCGIATFTHDLHQAISTVRPNPETSVVAMTDHGRVYEYPPVVRCRMRDQSIEDYVRAAEYLNGANFDVVSLQHEFGIFGGEAGCYIVELLRRLHMPIVTTLHTILPKPTPAQRAVLETIIGFSAKIVVMSETGRRILRSTYRVSPDKIELIPHGIPDVPFLETHQAKAKLGFGDRTVILTFGLLSPNKGIEVMIDAMPAIVARCPNAVYVVLGATHPNLVLNQGEAYRESLVARVRRLGIESHIEFVDQFVDQATLLEFISMCDVYVTPYLNEAQMTSGTLAYSFGLGRAVVSTPYWHAKELLADGRGVLVPFGDSKAIGAEIIALLTNDVRRHAMRKRAYAASREMTWKQSAIRYLAVLEEARDVPAETAPLAPAAETPERAGVFEMQTGHLRSMCDDTGLLQHAVHAVADRHHGYCVDDNARALILACALDAPGETRLPASLTARFAAFVQNAWNPDRRRFRNFMSYGRFWLEEQGSEDSHARTLWALGECVKNPANPSRQRWAKGLFETALPAVEDFRSPRAWAFTLLGIHAYGAGAAAHPSVARIRDALAGQLMAGLAAVTTPGWIWFEDELAYDNARLPQALILTGLATANPSAVEAGLKSLRWLMRLQTTSSGFFRPVGTEGFGVSRQLPQKFDQQPVDAAATISACLAAWQATHSREWANDAERAFRWFLGDNDLGISLVDPETGACSDGLHRDRRNENNGAESVLSYLLGLAEMRRFARAGTTAQCAEEPIRIGALSA